MTSAAAEGGPPLVACHDCGLLHSLPPAPPGHDVTCRRCEAVLRTPRHRSLPRCTAFAASALILLGVSVLFPLLTFELEGRAQPGGLLSGTEALWSAGYPTLALLVLFTVFLAPLLRILGLLYVTAPLLAGRGAPGAGSVFRLLGNLRPWAMLEVFLLGLIVAYVKLAGLASLEVGTSLFALVGLILAMVCAEATLDPFEVWDRLSPQRRAPVDTAGSVTAGGRLVSCHGCGQLEEAGRASCPRCGAALHRRKPGSLRRTGALTLAAALLYVPANLLPIMTVIYFGAGEPDTILSGVETLVAANQWPIALLIFFASIAVPLLKLTGLAFLTLSVRFRSAGGRKRRTRLYRIIEGVGRWSMVDVFMISLLAALVKLGNIATVAPEPGAVAFAAVVVVTMLASHAFDPRLIWDGAGPEEME
ncbi:paraquat-inducible protein A [Azospirillum sp. SYSU D00513]|uniref:paraquat-inducible protein A n=1 Tax=Azospirillum sp. SYSU D00513 TaxID=2812561 RepID=UPI001A97031C